MLQGAVRECYEETGYRFVADSTEPFFVTEAWFWTSRRTYMHAMIFVYGGFVDGEVDMGWSQDVQEIVEVAWLRPEELTEATTRTVHWAALRKAGLV